MLAHAVEHGTGPHEHDGVECTLIAQDDQSNDALPVLPSASAPPVPKSSDAPRRAVQQPPSWATPPKTGPPTA